MLSDLEKQSNDSVFTYYFAVSNINFDQLSCDLTNYLCNIFRN